MGQVSDEPAWRTGIVTPDSRLRDSEPGRTNNEIGAGCQVQPSRIENRDGSSRRLGYLISRPNAAAAALLGSLGRGYHHIAEAL